MLPSTPTHIPPQRTTSKRLPAGTAHIITNLPFLAHSSSSSNMLSPEARQRAVAALDPSHPNPHSSHSTASLSPVPSSHLHSPRRSDMGGGDNDSDFSPSPFVLPTNIRPNPSDFTTISHHLSLNRSQPTNLPPANPLSPEEIAASQADAYIQQGIQLHEQLNLTESTLQFEKAANLGSATGMYLFGMALRSGWGVPRDEVRAFEFLSRAADLALRQSSKRKSDNDRDASARELTLAIYELGQSFRNGWGVKKDRRTGVHYLQIAANLGDPDAQVDVATAYLNGDGVKRDKVTAAKYFRLAENNGFTAPGMTWIWKSKYDVTGVLQLAKPSPTFPSSPKPK